MNFEKLPEKLSVEELVAEIRYLRRKIQRLEAAKERLQKNTAKLADKLAGLAGANAAPSPREVWGS